MKKKKVTNEEIMERLNKLEKSNTMMSSIFLLYSIAITLIVAYFSVKNILFLILGIISYITGLILTNKNKIKLP